MRFFTLLFILCLIYPGSASALQCHQVFPEKSQNLQDFARFINQQPFLHDFNNSIVLFANNVNEITNLDSWTQTFIRDNYELFVIGAKDVHLSRSLKALEPFYRHRSKVKNIEPANIVRDLNTSSNIERLIVKEQREIIRRFYLKYFEYIGLEEFFQKNNFQNDLIQKAIKHPSVAIALNKVMVNTLQVFAGSPVFYDRTFDESKLNNPLGILEFTHELQTLFKKAQANVTTPVFQASSVLFMIHADLAKVYIEGLYREEISRKKADPHYQIKSFFGKYNPKLWDINKSELSIIAFKQNLQIFWNLLRIDDSTALALARKSIENPEFGKSLLHLYDFIFPVTSVGLRDIRDLIDQDRVALQQELIEFSKAIEVEFHMQDWLGHAKDAINFGFFGHL